MNRNENLQNFGTLYVVATPIGNLRDMTPRAIETLKTVQLIAVEDTRHSALLLQQFAISTPMLALHDHNERERTQKILERLRQGESIALISDAGTPLISDPGYYLVREARELGAVVVPIPGASAAIAALSVSGLATDKFIFEGFLPAKSKARLACLESLRCESRTMIFYEAPHRVLECLQDMVSVWGGERQAVLARELTKLYETIRSGALAELVAWVQEDSNQQRGEIVLLVAGSADVSLDKEDDSLLVMLLAELPLKKAVEIAAKVSGQRKNEVYQKALLLKKNG